MFFVSALMATVTASATPRCVALTHPSRPSESLVQVGYPSLPESLLYLFSSPASTANVTAYVTRGAFPAHPSRFRGEFPALRIAHLGARPSLSSTLPSRLALLSEQAKSFAPSLIRVAAAGQHPGPVQPAAADADDPRQHAERLQHQQGPEKGRSSESSESYVTRSSESCVIPGNTPSGFNTNKGQKKVAHPSHPSRSFESCMCSRGQYGPAAGRLSELMYFLSVCARACARVRVCVVGAVTSSRQCRMPMSGSCVRACARVRRSGGGVAHVLPVRHVHHVLLSRVTSPPQPPLPCPTECPPPPSVRRPASGHVPPLARAGLSPSLLSPGPSLRSCGRGVSRSRGCGPGDLQSESLIRVFHPSRSSESIIRVAYPGQSAAAVRWPCLAAARASCLNLQRRAMPPAPPSLLNQLMPLNCKRPPHTHTTHNSTAASALPHRLPCLAVPLSSWRAAPSLPAAGPGPRRRRRCRRSGPTRHRRIVFDQYRI